MSEVIDSYSQPLGEGDRVMAWWDGVPYTARVTRVWAPTGHCPDLDRPCNGHRHLVLDPGDGAAPMAATSDQVTVIP